MGSSIASSLLPLNLIKLSALLRLVGLMYNFSVYIVYLCISIHFLLLFTVVTILTYSLIFQVLLYSKIFRSLFVDFP